MTIEKNKRIHIDSQMTVGQLLDCQRDADHQHYLEQFVKWLEENSEGACNFGEYQNVVCLSKRARQSLLQQAEGK